MAIFDKLTEKRKISSEGWSFASRLFVIGFLLLIFMLPVRMVQGIIIERAVRQTEAIREVSSKWGGSQNIVGPILVIPYHPYGNQYKTTAPVDTQLRNAYFMPEVLSIDGTSETQMRSRGIYNVPVYDAKIKLTGKFSAPDLASLSLTADKMYWDKAYLTMGGLDLKGLTSQIDLTWQKQAKQFAAGIKSKLFGVSSELTAPVSVSSDGSYNFDIAVNVRGSNDIFFVPVAKDTKVAFKSDWQSPSFDGSFLPTKHEITNSGFTAEWQVFDLNRSLPAVWTYPQNQTYQQEARPVDFSSFGSNRVYSRDGGRAYSQSSIGEFGVKLFTPVDIYQKTTRSAKYAMSVIALVFLIYFLIEAAARRRVNPLQYILVGLALCIFYTLQLSLSEYISFWAAYLIASVAIIGMVGLFTKSVLNSGKLGLVAGGVLTFLYGFVYILLESEDYTLLIGSIGLFIILGIVMYFSRYVQWYKEEKTELPKN